LKQRSLLRITPPVAYYASALALYRFDSLIRKKAMDVKYRPFKYHLLAIIRMRLGGIVMPAMSSNSFEKYCEGLVVALQDEKKYVTLFRGAVGILDTALELLMQRRDEEELRGLKSNIPPPELLGPFTGEIIQMSSLSDIPAQRASPHPLKYDRDNAKEVPLLSIAEDLCKSTR